MPPASRCVPGSTSSRRTSRRKGHRIGLIVQSSNTVWAVPDDPGATVTVAEGPDSRLLVPFAPR